MENEKINEQEIENNDVVSEAEVVQEVVYNQHVVDSASVEKAIRNSVMVSAGLGIVPLPFFDFAALTATGLSLTRKLSEMYGIEFKEGVAKKLIVSVVSASVPSFATRPVSSLLVGIPLIGIPLAVGTRPALNGMVTYAIGHMFVNYFESGGNFIKANVEVLKKEFKTAFKGSREKIGDIIGGKNEKKAEAVN